MTITLKDQMIEDQFDADWYLLQDEDTAVYNWNTDIPAVIQQAAANICIKYEGFVLTSIAHVVDTNTYVAWYTDTTLHSDEDGHTLFREFHLIDNKAVDITA